MGDAVRPSEAVYQQVLQESLDTWSSYLGTGGNDLSLSLEAVDLKPLATQTPPFLGDGLVPPGETISFACEESPAALGSGNLLLNCRSTWKTSKGSCDLPPIVLPKWLLLAVGSRLNVRLSEDAPLAEWPGVKGLEGYDEGNYLAVLYFAWAYILSARWVELLSRSADHESRIDYRPQVIPGTAPQPDAQPTIEIELGQDVSAQEGLWWRTILSCDDCWGATTKYNGQTYLSPWSLSAKEARMTVSSKVSQMSQSSPPSSGVAVGYLTRFCDHYRLYAQCSVALSAALYIPFLGGRAISLPFPRQLPRAKMTAPPSSGLLTAIHDLLATHQELLPRYMTLSSNPWGLRSLLYSTFFNPKIDCNLVSAWLNPAFAVLESISSKSPSSIAAVLCKRHPQLGILWLGAVCSNVETQITQGIHAGMVALDLPVSGWSGIPQTFLTSEGQHINSDSIHRDDECRLLFITATEGHDRPPVWPWKPFGVTQLCDTELTVREHAECAATHCLEYQSWEWLLSNGDTIEDFDKGDKRQIYEPTSSSATSRKSAVLVDLSYDLLSQDLSEGHTHGIFQWLRSTGYPENEKSIYEHSWIDMEDTDDEEPDDTESNVERELSPARQEVQSWLDCIEGCC